MHLNCVVCDVLVRIGGAPDNTPEKRSQATHRFMVPNVHFGRNRRTVYKRGHQPVDPTFTEDHDPWDRNRETVLMCMECRDELLGQTVMLCYDLALLSSLIRQVGLSEEHRTTDRSKMAGRVQLFHEVIRRGLEVLTEERNCPLEPAGIIKVYGPRDFWPPSGPLDEYMRRRDASLQEPKRDESP